MLMDISAVSPKKEDLKGQAYHVIKCDINWVVILRIKLEKNERYMDVTKR